jgi:hypothetical protein
MSTTTQQKIEFTRVDNDGNGNPRYVCSWLYFNTKTYSEAVKLANEIGGRKYNTKSFPMCIVFKTHNTSVTEKQINKLTTNPN